MTDEIPQAALDAARKLTLAEAEGVNSAEKALARMLAKHPEYVMEPKEPDVPLLAMKEVVHIYHSARFTLAPPYSTMVKAHADVLAKHGYAMVNFLADEERRSIPIALSDHQISELSWQVNRKTNKDVASKELLARIYSDVIYLFGKRLHPIDALKVRDGVV